MRIPNLQAPCHRGIAVLLAVVLVFTLILVVAYAAEAETTAACEVDQGKLARPTTDAPSPPGSWLSTVTGKISPGDQSTGCCRTGSAAEYPLLAPPSPASAWTAVCDCSSIRVTNST